MNVQLPENIVEAISLVPGREWHAFFHATRLGEYNMLTGTSDSELTSVKYRVMIINELEHLFLTARQSTSTEK